MTCREAVLEAMERLRSRLGRDTFDLYEIVLEVQSRSDAWKESTIRTHVVSAMCVNAPKNHAVQYDDLIRVSRGRYALRPAPSGRQ